MKFADLLAMTCPSCAVESRHSSRELLALRATCPACGASFADAGSQIRALVDNAVAFQTWAEVLLLVEERLGIAVSDAELLGGRQHFAGLTLREMVGVVESQLSVEPVAPGRVAAAVLDAASSVARHPVAPSRMSEPILLALDISP